MDNFKETAIGLTFWYAFLAILVGVLLIVLNDLEAPAALLEQIHPDRVLDPLVNGLSRLVQTRRKVEDRVRVTGIEKGERLPLELWTLLLPQIDAKLALRREWPAEHGLSGKQTTVSHVVRRTVRDHGHIMAVLKQANPELQPGLAGTNDQKARQRPPFRVSKTDITRRLGPIGSV